MPRQGGPEAGRGEFEHGAEQTDTPGKDRSRRPPLPYPVRLGRNPIAIAMMASIVTTRMAAANISTSFGMAQSPDDSRRSRVCTSRQALPHQSRVAGGLIEPDRVAAPLHGWTSTNATTHTPLSWCCGFPTWHSSIGSCSPIRRMHPDGQERPALTGSPTDGTIGGERDPTDGIWMTKAQLAAVRRISVASADRLIRRQGWRKHPGNDGRARVLVPRTWAEPSRNGATDAPPSDPTDKTPDHPTDAASNPTDISSAINALERAIVASEKRADQAENRANLAGDQGRTG